MSAMFQLNTALAKEKKTDELDWERYLENHALQAPLPSYRGGDEEMPGTVYSTIVADNGYRRGDSGAAVRLDYDVSNPGDYAFYWMKLGRPLRGKSDSTETLNLSKYNYLAFWIKGKPDLMKIKVEIH